MIQISSASAASARAGDRERALPFSSSGWPDTSLAAGEDSSALAVFCCVTLSTSPIGLLSCPSCPDSSWDDAAISVTMSATRETPWRCQTISRHLLRRGLSFAGLLHGLLDERFALGGCLLGPQGQGANLLRHHGESSTRLGRMVIGLSPFVAVLRLGRRWRGTASRYRGRGSGRAGGRAGYVAAGEADLEVFLGETPGVAARPRLGRDQDAALTEFIDDRATQVGAVDEQLRRP